ncbi:MAG: hypothetical protein AAF236_05690, partial [Verrucomicrobiota bacterium]
MQLSRPSFSALALVALLATIAGFCTSLKAQESTSEKELRVALSLARQENERLRLEALRSEAQRKELAKSLAEAVRVSEEQLLANRETQLQLQAFGVDLLTRDENSLEQRLLKAVRDLDIAQQQIDQQSGAVHQLSEVLLETITAHSEISSEQKAKALAAIETANGALAAA